LQGDVRPAVPVEISRGELAAADARFRVGHQIQHGLPEGAVAVAVQYLH
jgi:hypothetical protein